MYENYKNQFTYDPATIDPQRERTYEPDPYAVPIPGGRAMVDWGFPFPVPLWYSGWRDETLSWHLTCSFHAHLNPSPITIIRGPEAKKFLSANFVNNIEKFPIGVIKHGIMCTENGLVGTHGVLIRTAEDTYEAFWHSPYIDFAFTRDKYDAELIDVSDKRFIFQLQGPKSLEIVEAATGDDLHDLAYRHFRDSSINGHWVRVVRFGMSGGLGYELHGDLEFAKEIYKKIMDVGVPFGIRPIGQYAYMMNHTPGGFVQSGVHFSGAADLFIEGVNMKSANNDLQDFLAERSAGSDDWFMSGQFIMPGSVGPDLAKRVFNPFEIGLGGCINWNHEFVGKAALEELRKTCTRNIVTLEWNPEDILEIQASQFRPAEESYTPIDNGEYERVAVSLSVQSVDRVLDKDGNDIGVSMGRTYSEYHRVMLSLCSLEEKYRELGTEVYVLWGNPGTRQFKIRAKVVPFPYNTHLENATFDVETIPHPVKK